MRAKSRSTVRKELVHGPQVWSPDNQDCFHLPLCIRLVAGERPMPDLRRADESLESHRLCRA